MTKDEKIKALSKKVGDLQRLNDKYLEDCIEWENKYTDLLFDGSKKEMISKNKVTTSENVFKLSNTINNILIVLLAIESIILLFALNK